MTTRTATEAQVSYAMSLIRETYQLEPTPANVDYDEVRAAIEKFDLEVASELIDGLKKYLEGVKATQKKPEPVETVGDGFYARGNEVYKVQWNLAGTRKYAKVLNPETGKFEYVGMKPLTFLTPADTLTLGRAKELGHLYGVCCRCGRTLTNEASIEAGIGPICAEQF